MLGKKIAMMGIEIGEMAAQDIVIKNMDGAAPITQDKSPYAHKIFDLLIAGMDELNLQSNARIQIKMTKRMQI